MKGILKVLKFWNLFLVGSMLQKVSLRLFVLGENS